MTRLLASHWFSPGVVVRVSEEGPAPVTDAVHLGTQGQAAVQITPGLVPELSETWNVTSDDDNMMIR